MKPSHHLVFTVTNDLSYDQRMHRICSTLSKDGYDVTLIGRRRGSSKPLEDRRYKTVRIHCIFEKGKLFYLEYNFRLLLRLLFTRAYAFGAVDLDTALAVYFAAKLRSTRWTFDAHEYFSELEEVISRPVVHRIWQWVEAFIMKRARVAYTISEGYASMFQKRYGTTFSVIRNVPLKSTFSPKTQPSTPYVIYQGALNIGRGIEESITAMSSIDGLELHIYGDGPIAHELQQQIALQGLEHKVFLKGSIAPENLKEKTQNAFAGLTLFSDRGLHHQHSLANRFFDYFHARIPQVVVAYSEYTYFNSTYSIAVEIELLDATNIAGAIRRLQGDSELYDRLVSNCSRAIAENNWQTESQKLLDIYHAL